MVMSSPEDERTWGLRPDGEVVELGEHVTIVDKNSGERWRAEVSRTTDEGLEFRIIEEIVQ